MTGGGGSDPTDRGVAGGPARDIPVLRSASVLRHTPVLRDEAVAATLGGGTSAGAGLFLDATFGAGGYTAAILDSHPGIRVLALDRDPVAVRGGAVLAAGYGARLRLVEARFGAMEAVAASLAPFDGIVLDIGVSSMQLDEAERGFSFRRDGPLDMRMGAEAGGPTAADLVNTLGADELANVFYHYGEERLSRRIARAIVMDRTAAPFRTTAALAGLIARIVPHKPTDIHPATRAFQALRIAVNDELGELVSALSAAERLLKPGGRLAVVTFHSLEDRIVKQFFARRSGKGEAPGRRLPGEPAAIDPSFTLPKGQPVVPSEAECAANPRARSAKLRHGTRTGAPALPVEPALRGLASPGGLVSPSSLASPAGTLPAGKPGARKGRDKGRDKGREGTSR